MWWRGRGRDRQNELQENIVENLYIYLYTDFGVEINLSFGTEQGFAWTMIWKVKISLAGSSLCVKNLSHCSILAGCWQFVE